MSPLLLGVALTIAAPALKDKPHSQDLYGEWEFESLEEEGRARPPDTPPPRFRFNKDGTYQVFRGDKEAAGRRGYKFDPTAVPPALDYNTPPAPPASPVLLAVYRVDGDRLTVCRANLGKPRPTELASPPGSGLLVVRFRRVKPRH